MKLRVYLWRAGKDRVITIEDARRVEWISE